MKLLRSNQQLGNRTPEMKALAWILVWIRILRSFAALSVRTWIMSAQHASGTNPPMVIVHRIMSRPETGLETEILEAEVHPVRALIHDVPILSILVLVDTYARSLSELEILLTQRL